MAAPLALSSEAQTLAQSAGSARRGQAAAKPAAAERRARRREEAPPPELDLLVHLAAPTTRSRPPRMAAGPKALAPEAGLGRLARLSRKEPPAPAVATHLAAAVQQARTAPPARLAAGRIELPMRQRLVLRLAAHPSCAHPAAHRLRQARSAGSRRAAPGRRTAWLALHRLVHRRCLVGQRLPEQAR